MQMKEKIFTISVNDAFDSGCECPGMLYEA